MTHRHRWIAAALFIGCLQLAGCREASSTADDQEKGNGPAKVEHLQGAEPTRVTLTEKAAKRLDIQTAAVADTEVDGKRRRVMPYAAVLYDTEGGTWTYIQSAPLTFVRHRIAVDRIQGDRAVLTDGLASGTLVVTVGAAELYGSEFEFAEE